VTRAVVLLVSVVVDAADDRTRDARASMWRRDESSRDE
jgi:hypothetical protein